MRLNDIKPGKGARKTRTRVARGIGSGLGKTAGRGHKGQHARAGNTHRVGFEGGQMPLQRRLPKVGFRSLKKADTIDLIALHAAGLVSSRAKKVKVVLKGEITRAVKLQGVLATAGAKAAIEAAGGSVE